MELLKEKVQFRFGRSILFSNDCIELAEHINSQIGVRISAQTLRRFFKFIKDEVENSKRTLNILSQYCGYNDYLQISKEESKHNYSLTSTQIIKLFYQIDHLNEYDINYHTAAGNIAKAILK